MARTYADVDNQRGYAFVVFAREYEKHMGYGWFVALRNVGAAPSKWDWMGEALAAYDADPGDDPHATANRIVKDMSRSLYRENKHRLRHEGPSGAQIVYVMDVPTSPGLLPRVYDGLPDAEPNCAAAATVLRISELPFTEKQRAVFDAWWSGEASSDAEAAAVLGVTEAAARSQRRAIRKKVEKSGIRVAQRSVTIGKRSDAGSGAVEATIE